jgi:glycosyltransferase involved in cell wall biosynthesis
VSGGLLKDPPHKRLLRWGYGAALTLQTYATARRRNGAARVWYGGARIGDVGGTLVKLRRLSARFPERRADYNLVYLLSNAPYLTPAALRRLRAQRVPVVLNQNGVFYPAWFNGDCGAMNARMASAYHAADHVFWQSAFCRLSADRFLGPRAGAGEILHNAVDTRLFVSAPRAENCDVAFTFLMTGKFDRHMAYRPIAAIEALALARRGGLQARLVVSGRMDPALHAQLQALAETRGVASAVALTGIYSQAQAPAIYATADAYLALTYNDACPNAVIEAMACGLPVLYSNSGGTPELVGEEAGVALDVEQGWDRIQVPEPAAIAAGMAAIAVGRDAMADAARARAVARFDVESWLGRHDAVFGALLGEGP